MSTSPFMLITDRAGRKQVASSSSAHRVLKNEAHLPEEQKTKLAPIPGAETYNDAVRIAITEPAEKAKLARENKGAAPKAVVSKQDVITPPAKPNGPPSPPKKAK